jgi:hypothetical protein
MPNTQQDNPVCRCIIRHAVTDTERGTVWERFEEARKAADQPGTFFALAQLTGDCPARTPR